MNPEQDNQQKPSVSFTKFFGENTVASAVIVGSVIIGLSIFAAAFMLKNGSVNFGSTGTPAQALQGAGNTAPTTNVKVADRSDEPTLGSANAPVTIYEFGDFQCPYCKQFFSATLGDLKTKYIDTGKVKLVFRHFPLPFHVNAQISAEAAECANRQGKFEAYHDVLYTDGQADGTGLDSASLKKYAAQVGLNMTTFNTCLDTHQTKAVVAADAALGSQVGVSGTPTFFINGTMVLGAQPTATFEQTIDAALKS